jgi:murein DD-endopeptidase MepM/ murein hydrolase activator NlpD
VSREYKDEEPTLTLMAVPHGGRQTRTLRVTHRHLRGILLAVAGLAILLVLMAGSWWYLAARAWEANALEARLTQAEADLGRVEALALALVEVESAYEHLRSLFGSDSLRGAAEVWLPPPSGRPTAMATTAAGDPPSGWPLTERGFLTQALIEGGSRDPEHPGIDIAIPSGSYVLAAGDGIVVDVAEDPIYGLHLVLDHGGGYRTLYGHASFATVQPGDRVFRGEVVALSGSTGRSTAPHLHFEILRDGEPVDPLALVQRP